MVAALLAGILIEVIGGPARPSVSQNCYRSPINKFDLLRALEVQHNDVNAGWFGVGEIFIPGLRGRSAVQAGFWPAYPCYGLI